MRFESRCAVCAALVVAVCGCGGKIADDTSGTLGAPDDASASSSSDGGAGTADTSTVGVPESSTDMCSDETLDIEQSGASTCSTSQKWSCGASHYEFRCACPYGTCECFEDGVQKKAISNYPQCPGCIIPADAIESCGFPH